MKRYRIYRALWQAAAAICAVSIIVAIYFNNKERALFVAALVSAIIFALATAILITLSRRPDKEWIRTKGTFSPEFSRDLTYSELLNRTRKAFDGDADEHRNRIIKPDSYATHPYCKYDVLRSGKIVYGCIVQANSNLFDKPRDLHKSFPAALIYGREDYFEENPEALVDIAKAFYDDKENNLLSDELKYFANVRLPDSLAGGREVYASTTMIYRYHLPFGMLFRSFTLVPIIADLSCDSSFVIDAKYWPNELKIKYYGIETDKTEADIIEEKIQSEVDFIYGGSKMRKLTLLRKRSFVECFSRVYVYVECPEALATVEIGSRKCKDAGIIKNGKSITVDITDDETTIYLASSTMQTSYTIPAGSEDISLVAAPKYDPTEGNPFYISPLL